MSVWKIYGIRNGVTTVVSEVHRLSYKGEWMDDETVTVDINSAVPVDFMFGDYLTYRGERFVIDYDPNVIKCARRNSAGDAFRYENVILNCLLRETQHVGFHDVVLADNQIPYTSLAKFSFFAATVEDLADRLQANLDRALGTGAWMIVTPNRTRTQQRCSVSTSTWATYFPSISDDANTYRGETDKDIVVDNISCREALKLCYSTFGLSYISKDRMIVIGGDAIMADRVFRYGMLQGLTEIERTSDRDAEVVTKLYAYGSTANLPLGYYANLYKKPFLLVTGDYAGGSTEYGLSVELENVSSYSVLTHVYYSNGSTIKHGTVSVECGGVEMEGYAEVVLGSNRITFRLLATAQGGTAGSVDAPYITYTDLATLNAFKAQLSIGARVYITDGVDINKFDADHIYTAEGYPELLMVNNLMLPGFPSQSLHAWVSENEPSLLTRYTFSNDPLRPWIRSRNADIIGDREKSIYYDGSDLYEIKPTIENTVYDELQWAQKVSDNGILPSDATDSQLQFRVQVLDGGIEWDYSGDTVKISMRNGFCVGREFEVKKAVKSSGGLSGRWMLTLERQYDDALQRYFPYNHYSDHDSQLYQLSGVDNHYPSGTDNFVVTGIPLPKSYVDAAARRVLIAACGYLDKHDHVKYTYRPQIDNIYMQRQHDNAALLNPPTDVDGTVAVVEDSLHDELKPGTMFQFEDAADLGIERYGSASIYIDQLTIEEGKSSIPEYEVTLRDEKEKGLVETLTSKIDELLADPPTTIVERATKTLTYVEYEEWSADGLYYSNAINTATGVLETSDVWHYGCKWRCLRTGTTEEPRWDSSDWLLLEGNSTLTMEFTDTEGTPMSIVLVRRGNIDLTVVPHVYFGYYEITDTIADNSMIWTRHSVSSSLDEGWNNTYGRPGLSTSHVNSRGVLSINDTEPYDFPSNWDIGQLYFECSVTIADYTLSNTLGF